MAWEIIGLVGGFMTAIALLPQLFKAWKTKSTKDISLLWSLIFMVALFLWVVYGFKNRIVPLMIFSSFEFIFATAVFILKIKYK